MIREETSPIVIPVYALCRVIFVIKADFLWKKIHKLPGYILKQVSYFCEFAIKKWALVNESSRE